jgi:hypothetical protein
MSAHSSNEAEVEGRGLARRLACLLNVTPPPPINSGLGEVSVAFPVEELKQFVGCELDLFVVELGCPVVAGDEAGAVQPTKVPERERIAVLRVVGRSDLEAKVPGAELVPVMRFQKGVLDFCARLCPLAIGYESRRVGRR